MPSGAQTLEILLLMTTAPSVGSASRLRPMSTGAPGNALRVNIAANAEVGSSRAITVSAIFAGFGASLGMNSNRVQPTRNPAGSAACEASQARCALRSEKVRFVLGTGWTLVRRDVE